MDRNNPIRWPSVLRYWPGSLWGRHTLRINSWFVTFVEGRMNLTKFEDIFNLTERLREEAENSPDTGDEFGYWTEGVLLVLRLVLNAISLSSPHWCFNWTAIMDVIETISWFSSCSRCLFLRSVWSATVCVCSCSAWGAPGGTSTTWWWVWPCTTWSTSPAPSSSSPFRTWCRGEGIKEQGNQLLLFINLTEWRKP